MEGVFLFVAVLSLLITAFIGVFIANAKNRSGGEGFALGCLLGPFGLLIEALLPTKTPSPPSVNPPGAGVPRRESLPPGLRRRASDGRLVRECPFCAEEVLANAVVCRFCNRDIEPVELPQEPEPVQEPLVEVVVDCVRCHTLNPGSASTCSNCGAPLEEAKRFERPRPGVHLCATCGKPLAPREAVKFLDRFYCSEDYERALMGR